MFRTYELDLDLLQKLYYTHQQEYLRKRLRAIKAVYEGQSRYQVCRSLGCSYNALTKWIDVVLLHGLAKLVAPIKHPNTPQRLSSEQKKELKRMILEKSPRDYGIVRNLWTADIMIEVIQSRWNISLKSSRIYEILEELGLSYQRAHRDYEPPDKDAQKAFVEQVKKLEHLGPKEIILFFDEFSVSDRPSLFYGWAEVNTRPEVPSNEKRKRNRVNGFLSVDAITGKEYLLLSPHAKTEDVASYLGLLFDDLHSEGYEDITIYLDNNSTHKKKMKSKLARLLPLLGLEGKVNIEFSHIPAYSPDFNLAEYIIHQIRLQILHHMPIDATLDSIEVELETYLDKHQLQTPEQIKNTLEHIFNLTSQS
ncbi:IS630 family transposase [Moorena sp. SIO3H5]|uniref:IS630 family transposase n=1 Tax=Moorena sp. SIO3H5 TaxID=2607834 RepID=UPI0013BE1E92|nr:IS630 family transposase [Moorena sp. SIO3H5]NEO74638.1 IS630 family transposase [Moorena sp. SIO3H5]